MRKYYWDSEVLMDLASIESIVHSSFPDTSELKKRIASIRNGLRETMESDEELKQSFEKLTDAVEEASNDSMFARLTTFQEVV